MLEQLTHDQHQGSKNDLVHCGGVEPKNRRCYQRRCARVPLGGSSCAGLPLWQKQCSLFRSGHSVCTFVCFARHVVGVVSLVQQVTMFAPQNYKNIVIFHCTALFSTTAALLRKVSRFCFTHAISTWTHERFNARALRAFSSSALASISATTVFQGPCSGHGLHRRVAEASQYSFSRLDTASKCCFQSVILSCAAS